MASDLLPPKKKKWPLILGGGVGVLLVLYFVLTSGAFIKGVVLPQVGSSLGSELTADDVALSPFSSLTLRGVKLTPKGAEQLASVAEVRVRYGLFAILGGNMRVDEVAVDSPAITVVEHPDGTGNLSKLLAGLSKSESKPKASSGPLKLDLHNVVLKNGSLRMTKQLDGGKTETTEVTGLNVTLDQLANGGSGKLAVAAGATLAQSAVDQITAKFGGAFELGVDANLLPRLLDGNLTADLTAATGAFKDYAGLGATLTAALTPTEMKQVRLAFRQRADELGRVTLGGPFDLAKKEARISYEIAGLDRRVLGVAGAAVGLDFAQTSVSATGRLDVAQLGTLVASNGRLTASRFSLAGTNGTTPELDISFDYKFSVNLTDKTALIEKVDLVVKQVARDLARGGLDRSMNLSWDKAQPGFREATYGFTVTGLDLAAWRPLAGPSVPAGNLDLTLKVKAENDGRLLKFTVGSDLRDLALEAAGTAISGVGVTANASGSIEDFTAFLADSFSLGVKHRGGQLATFKGSGHFDTKNHDLGGQLSGEVGLPAALGLVPVTGVSASAGTVKLSGQYGSKPGNTNGSVDISLVGFNGRSGAMDFHDYQARISATADIVQGTLTLQRGNITLQNGFEPGGTLDASGKFDLGRRTGRFEFRSVNVNQNGLAPFIANALAPNRLVSIALDVTGAATLDAAGESSVQGDVKVTKFLVDDPGHTLPKTPLSLGLGLDAGQRGAVTDLRKFRLTLGATSRAGNELVMSGKFDLSTNKPSPSSLTVKSDALDLTPLYNLFAGDRAAKKAPATDAKPSVESGGKPDVEPAPIKLPLQQFGLDLDIKRVHLRDVALSNWVAKVTIDKNAISVSPFSLTLNGAPVTASIHADVGVPGYTYDVALSGDRIPLPPLVSSFQPERAGQIGGTAGAKVAVKGAGITGANLQKNLTGQFELGATNLNLKLADVKSPLLKTIVNVVIGIPDLIRSPSLGTLASLTGLGGSAGKGGGFVDELSQAPIGSISAKAVAGGGKVDLQQALVLSPAFSADSKGSIVLAAVLTNSALDLPVGVALKDSLGKKIGLTEAVDGYARMPDFLTVKGTVGVPKPEIAYAKLALLAGKAGLGLVGGTAGALGEKATGLLEAVTGAGSKTNSAAPGTALGNALGNLLGGSAKPADPAKTNAAPAPGLLDLFKKPKK